MRTGTCREYKRCRLPPKVFIKKVENKKLKGKPTPPTLFLYFMADLGLKSLADSLLVYTYIRKRVRLFKYTHIYERLPDYFSSIN